MDRELAGVVLEKWGAGEAVGEVQLYKAASALGIDPMAALVEARFYTYLDSCLIEKRAMSVGERIVFSAAAGMSPGPLVKTASAYGVSADELIIEALRERDFVPDIVKIANLSAAGGDPTMMDPAVMQQAGAAMAAPPQQDASVQQQPIARFKPSPTGPEQTMAAPGGNMDELLQQGQQAFGQQAQDNGGTAPAGMPEPAPPPPSPEERIQQVGPNLDQETVARYADQLQRFEAGFDMQISDPKQMVKFVKELQKLDGKRIDQGIKAMSQQLEQEQAAELGVDSAPTIDGPGGGAGGGPGTQMAPKPGQDNAAGGAEGSPQGGPPAAQSVGGDASANAQQLQGQQAPQQSPQPPKKQPPAQPPADAAVEKVAHAARVIARASLIFGS